MSSSFGATNVVVAVRARPLTPQEEEKGGDGKLTISMDQTTKTTVLVEPGTGGKKKFRFDYNYWSVGDPTAQGYASQETIFHDLAEAQLKHALGGYNACIFAYGQTSSGKTYTMMGPPSHSDHSKFNLQTGLIPRMCDSLFHHIASADTATTSHRVEMSFYEIYNEKVYCLLDPSTNGSLRPREDPKAGPYVENLQAVQVTHYQQIAELLKIGNKTRHTSKTKMNDRSSRSHAVFCLTITKSEWQKDAGDAVELISRVNLVDLAGSERTSKAGTEGAALKEGININKSLTSLGMVIKKLADLNDPSVAADGSYVPYRDSTLTWLLKDNLGGNSRTVMLATLSPCRYNYDETHTTLRYAERVKLIKNAPSVNRRGSTRKIIKDLRWQIRQLNEQLSNVKPGLPTDLTFKATPTAIWATTPFIQTTPRYGEPYMWFVRKGYTVVTGVESYAMLQCEEGNNGPASGSVTPRKVGRKSSVKRAPSYLQPTLASAFKDAETAEQLKNSDTVLLGKDLAHTVIVDDEKVKAPVRRMRSVDMGSRKSSRRRSVSGGVGRRASVAKAMETANAKIQVENVKVVDDSEGEDDEGNVTPPTLALPLIKNRHSSILGVGLSHSALYSVPTTPRGEGSDTVEMLFTTISEDSLPATKDLLQSQPDLIKLAGLPNESQPPTAIFNHTTSGKVILLPISNTKINGVTIQDRVAVALPNKCEIQFGDHPSFVFVNPTVMGKIMVGTVVEGGEVDVLEEASNELLQDRAFDNLMFGSNGPTPAESMLQKRLQELQTENSLLKSERDDCSPPPVSSLPSISMTESGSWVVSGEPLSNEAASELIKQLSSQQQSSANGEPREELKVITASEYSNLQRAIIVEKARSETARRDIVQTVEQEKSEIANELEIAKQRLATFEFQNAKQTERVADAAVLQTEKQDLRVQIEDLNKSIGDGERQRNYLEMCVKRLEASKQEDRRQYESKLDSEEYKSQQKQIELEVNDKYRQLDILKAQIGDKKHAASQLQDSYNERLTDLEREAWEKHRAIKELQVEEQDGVSRVQHLRQEEERLLEKLSKHKKAKEEVMLAKELNGIEAFELVGGLRLDDPTFRSKKIQLSRQSRTPICLKFTTTGVQVYNADAIKSATARQSRGPSRALSPAGRAISSHPVATDPIRDIPYERIQKVKLIDGCVIQVTAAGQPSDLGILCDNKVKRNAIQKLLALKTRGVILALPQSYTSHHDPLDASEEEGHSPGSGDVSPSGVPVISLNSAVRR